VSQQGLRLASLYSGTSERLGYNGAWLERFRIYGITEGGFNGGMISWINLRYGQTFDNLPGALAYMASVNGATNFSSMGTFSVT